MLDIWTDKGHILGECYYCEHSNSTYIHIPKNASSYIKGCLLSLNDWNYSTKFVQNNQYLIVLRDPIDRWISGMAQLIQSDPITNWSEDLIFNTITFDDHTEKQCYFLQYLDLVKNLDKCVFFFVDDTLSSKFTKWCNTLYPKVNINIGKLNASDDIDGRKSIIMKLQNMIDSNNAYLLKLKEHFAEDYNLIKSVKFYD